MAESMRIVDVGDLGGEPMSQRPGGPRLHCATWSDDDVIAAVACGSGDAYAELYRRFSPSVMAASRTILGNSPAPEDIVAEVFVEFWLAPGRFDPERGSLLGLLRLKARNRSIDVLRSDTRRRRRENDDAYVERNSLPEVDSTMLASEVSEALRRAVDALPPQERDVIRLAYFNGMSYRAVAVALDEAEGTVKSRIRRGLLHLRVANDAQLEDVRLPTARPSLSEPGNSGPTTEGTAGRLPTRDDAVP